MKFYHVDAFAEKIFEGNPAAVCVLENFPSDEIMLKIAMENNLSETAFAVKEGEHYNLRWFTPEEEVDLCGHATLAASFVLFNFFEKEASSITYHTLSGELTVVKRGNLFEMDLPAYEIKKIPVIPEMSEAFGVEIKEAWLGRDLVCVTEESEKIANLSPDMKKLSSLPGLIQHITGKGEDFDSLSRTFAPGLAISEDPVCGSGHCHIVPLWADKLGKSKILARQVSPRGGTLFCELIGDRVKISGSAVLYSVGEIFV